RSLDDMCVGWDTVIITAERGVRTTIASLRISDQMAGVVCIACRGLARLVRPPRVVVQAIPVVIPAGPDDERDEVALGGGAGRGPDRDLAVALCRRPDVAAVQGRVDMPASTP